MYPKELPTTTRYTLYLYWAANLSFFSSSFFTLSQREALWLNLLQSALNVFAPFAHVTDATPPPTSTCKEPVQTIQFMVQTEREAGRLRRYVAHETWWDTCNLPTWPNVGSTVHSLCLSCWRGDVVVLFSYWFCSSFPFFSSASCLFIGLFGLKKQNVRAGVRVS